MPFRAAFSAATITSKDKAAPKLVERMRMGPRSMAYLRPDLVAMLREAGFGAVERKPLGGGVAQLLVGTRR